MAPQALRAAHPDPHQTQPWSRLLHGGQFVGYARSTGRTELYSKDGYGWSGTAIRYDERAPQVPLRLSSERIYHGDLVRLAPPSGEEATVERVVAILSDGRVWLTDPSGAPDLALDEVWVPPAQPRIQKRLGSLLHEGSMQRRIAALERALSSTRLRRSQRLGALLAHMVIGLGLCALLQLGLLGHVGPLTSLAGGLLGSMLYWSRLRRACWSALRRRDMLALSAKAALSLGAAGMVLSAGALTFAEDAGLGSEVATRLVAGGALGALLGLICGALGADLVSWRTGGYAD